MITASIAFVLAMNAQAAVDPVEVQLAYRNCLVDFANESLDQKVPAGRFGEAINGACADQKQAFRDAVVADEMKYGSSREEALRYAEEEWKIIQASLVEPYPNYLKENARWVKND